MTGKLTPQTSYDFAQGHIPAWLIDDLRTDHAGELGAVWIYRGALTGTRNQEITKFAAEHLETEKIHLRGIESLISARERSYLLPLWRLFGFLTGYIAAIFGPHAFYATVAAVETFVDQHYAIQIKRLKPDSTLAPICLQLEQFRLDEVRHKDESLERIGNVEHPVLNLWCRLVTVGSRSAVAVSRRI